MKRPLLVSLAALIPLTAVAAESTGELAKPLAPLRPLLGKTWRGPFKNSTPEKPVYEVMKWERALNGQAVRILHSVNGGLYGGETILMWNSKTKQIEFHYFTTAGFVTRGTLDAEGGKFVTHEEVEGHQEGVTEVKGTTEFLPDHRLHVKSQYRKNGEWVDGHEVTYEESPASEVRFK